MPPLSSPYKAASVSRQRSTSPLPPPLPAKPIDLNSSTRSTDKETGAKVTKRAFLCDIIVGQDGEATTSLLHHLGRPLPAPSTLPVPPPPVLSLPITPSKLSLPLGTDDDDDESAAMMWTKQKEMEMTTKLASLIEELVRTERSYLSRIQALKKSYADPLRSFARQEYSKIIPMYEAKTLFTNIDAIVPASVAFLHDLETMFVAGDGARAIGDICLKHLKDLRAFDPYRAYISKQDESQKMFQDVLKKYSSFGSFIERTKYQTTGIGNIGLRELLMEPVQRIPRYTLLWQTMIKCMPPLSPQRTELAEAVEIASRIAKCEPDAQTVRATVMYCLERNVEGFPANLFSNNRDFIDSIDVEDLPVEYPTTSSPGSRLSHSSRPVSVTSASTSTSIPSLASFGSSGSSSQMPTSPQSNAAGPSSIGLSPLHCSLFLFDDKLMIVKRQSSSISGRKVTGLDDVQKLVKSGGGVAVLDKNGAKKDKLSHRGVVDVLDIIATDVGNGDFHLFFEKSPTDQGDRWSGRQFRSYSTVQPPFATSMDPVANKRDKLRFLQNLWAAQAHARTKINRKDTEVKAVPRVMVCDEEVGLERAGEMFGRASCYWNVWDRDGWSEAPQKAKVAIFIDEDGSSLDVQPNEEAPAMVIRLQPMAGSLCRFSYATIANDGEGRVLIDFNDIHEKIATAVHRYGIFKFRTSSASCPTTPSSTAHRLRPSMLNLDMISRNLFGHGTLNNKGQMSDMFGTVNTRRKSNVSRTSTIDTRYSQATTSSDERPRLSRLSSSPSERLSEDDDGLPALKKPYVQGDRRMGQSEIDLNERLNLARKNSKTMAAMSPPASRLAAKSVAELRSQVEATDMSIQSQNTRLAAKSVGDLRHPSEPADAQIIPSLPALHSRSPVPLSPTAPLRIRNKSPSPTKALSPKTTSPIPLPVGFETFTSSRHHTTLSIDAIMTQHTSDGAELTTTEHLSSVTESTTTTPSGPRQLPRPVVNPPPQSSSSGATTVSLSPRPQGPRSPAPRGLPVVPGLGSAHTKLRVVSGNGRRVSAGREIILLKGDENESPRDTAQSTSAKRQHSGDQLSPRKRSPPRSPFIIVADGDARVPDPLRVPSGGRKPSARKISDRNSARRSSGPLTSVRRVSAGTASINSQATSTAADDIFTPHHGDPLSAVTAAKRKIMESRASVKRLKSEVQILRKHLSNAPARNTVSYSNSSLPRSPHRRNINRLVDHTSSLYDEPPVSPRMAFSGKHELDAMLLDESARGLAAIADKLDGALRAALADGEQAEVLAGQLSKKTAEHSENVHSLQAQIGRAKESQDLLKQQLTDTQVEIDVIYEAFNTELDGMYNDAQLPETEAFEAMRGDLQLTKAKRNELALENMKLKRDLQEANLKRDQWAKILRERGVIQ